MTPADVYRGNLLWIALRFTVAATAFLIVATLLGAILSPWGVLAIPAAVFGALALTAPLTAYVATQEDDHKFPLIMRFLTLPMFLFSATFFPLSQLPALLQPIAWILPLYHSVSLCRDATTGTLAAGGWLAGRRPRGDPECVRRGGLPVGHAHLHAEVGGMSVADRHPTSELPVPATPGVDAAPARRVDVAAAPAARAQPSAVAACGSSSSR